VQTPLASQSALSAPGSDGRVTAAAVSAVLATVGVGVVGWIITVRRMHGMDMGVATGLGSLPGFLWLWIPMMAAMMLPSTCSPALRLVRAGARSVDLLPFAASYLGVWTLFGVIIYALYRPHGTVVAGALILAAGVYELTPMKRHFRRMGQQRLMSGSKNGLCCVGSNLGLMVMMAALGLMSLTWMAAMAVTMVLQKVVRPSNAIDVPVALAIIALGIVILAAPLSIPGLVPAMHPMPAM
jgi:predicted metal-binding membrane protein